RAYSPAVAFAVPGVLMALATFILWLGRDRFIRRPPVPGGKLGMLDALGSIALFSTVGSFFFTARLGWMLQLGISLACLGVGAALFACGQRVQQVAGFLPVLVAALRNRKPGQPLFQSARERFGDEAADGPPAVLRIVAVFSVVSLFWALFDQKASSWINQA